MYPENFRYTKEHEWVLADGDAGTIGITDHAQQELGDIVYVDLPKVGTRIDAGKSLGSVESVKAVSDIYSPVSGEITEIGAAGAGRYRLRRLAQGGNQNRRGEIARLGGEREGRLRYLFARLRRDHRNQRIRSEKRRVG